jgi:hypothetical protein
MPNEGPPDVDRLERLMDGVITAREGAGPLLQRDYWGVIRECRLSPTEVADTVAREFGSFAPPDLVRFLREEGSDDEIREGSELEVSIRMAGDCRVRAVHRDENSLTLATIEGHPEAGRITFGAYPNEAGDVVFHIRSRARSSSALKYAGFLTAGEAMQTTTWTDFIDRLANTVGEGVQGSIHAETQEIEDEPDIPEAVCSPTFAAVGDTDPRGPETRRWQS